jgi:hypothetical protein
VRAREGQLEVAAVDEGGSGEPRPCSARLHTHLVGQWQWEWEWEWEWECMGKGSQQCRWGCEYGHE